jgi:hypothetical protein
VLLIFREEMDASRPKCHFHPAGKLSRNALWRTRFARRSPYFNFRKSDRETAEMGILCVPSPFLGGRHAAGGHEQSTTADRQQNQFHIQWLVKFNIGDLSQWPVRPPPSKTIVSFWFESSTSRIYTLE